MRRCPKPAGSMLICAKGSGPCGDFFLVGCIHSGRVKLGGIHRSRVRPIFQFFDSGHCGADFYLASLQPISGKPYDFQFTWAQPLAVAAIALFTFINYLGVRLGGRVQIALTILKIASVLAIVAAGFWFGHGSWEHFHPFWPTGAGIGTMGKFFAALAAALWAYDGWEDLNRVGSEVQQPQRNIPLALIGGTILVGGIYLLFSAVCFYALPFAGVASSSHVASDVVATFAGRGAADWITLAMVVAALGTLNSSLLSGARVPYAMARDGLFFRVTGIVHPKFRTPGGALIFQGTWRD